MKKWYQSKTIWGALVVIVASLLRVAGYEFGEAEQAELTDAVSTIAGALGGILALYGRLTATQAISQK
ncbi:hypothetical protein NOF55_15170 [Rhizobiaceae bacterium BDR2-2]|uniref:Holin n=1 Tax=Ectorhizobium quercum TaxID=2965071 RepID=A0AAE3SWW5_9HYPH|nr:hypothetical protein [Ectorhizobium quercum]MCX8998454.1 hypothetical protein [Ectorhizobium quercum]